MHSPPSPDADNLGLSGQQFGLAALAVAILIWLTGGLILMGNVPWLSAVVYVGVGTAGLCFLLALCSLQLAEEDRRRRRQVNLRLILLAFVGLGMLLAGVSGIFRALTIDMSGMATKDALAVFLFFSILMSLRFIPLLIHLLAVVVTLANVVVRLPAMRRMLARRNRARNDSHDL